jgi:hypothetical protein
MDEIPGSEALIARELSEKRTISLPTDSLLLTFHWNLNTDRTGKIAFLGALPWIA